jgi:hypothetical protein
VLLEQLPLGRDAGILLGCDAAGNGLALELFVATTYLAFNFRALNGNALGAVLFSAVVPQASISTWQGSGAWAGPFAPGVYYHATATVTPGSGANANVAVVAVNIFNHEGGTSIFTGGYSTGQTYALCPCLGASYGVGTVMTGGMGQPYWTQLYFDNLILTGQAPAPSSSSLEATTYLYTLVNDLGEESGPCPAMISFDGSGTITRQIGEAVAVPLPASLAATGVDTSYFMVGAYLPPLQIGLGGAALVPNIPSPSMNLYRAVTGSTGTALLLVAANVPFGTVVQVGTSGATPPAGMTTGVIDALADSALSEAMISQLWSPPPASMLGILPLPNGIYAGFTGNTLCLSAQGVPHAWPIEYELDFDFPIVGIGNIDSTVVVCTENFPYLCSGATPDAYSQTKASYPYACASKRSIQFIQNVGVVFATFEGLVSIAGPGMERVMTRDLFSKLEWGELNPATMLSAVNDNRYFCWYDATGIGGAKAGFYLDLQPQSPYPGIPSIVSGKCSLAFHATVRYNDPLSDGLYMILDSSPAP